MIKSPAVTVLVFLAYLLRITSSELIWPITNLTWNPVVVRNLVMTVFGGTNQMNDVLVFLPDHVMLAVIFVI